MALGGGILSGIGNWFRNNPALGTQLAGAGTQLIGGALAGRGATRDREQQQRQFEASQQQQRDLSGRRGWDVADPLLRGAVGESQRIYDERLGQGPYARNVPRPTGGPTGASASARQIADRARDVALGGPGQGGQAGLDYISSTLGGGGPEGGAGGYLRQSADMFAGLPQGQGAGMYNQAFGQAVGGGNQYIDPLFNFARGLAGAGTGGSTSAGSVYSGGGGGGGGSRIDPNAYNIDPDDPRFHVDPQGFNIDPESGQIGANAPLDTQGFVQEMLAGGAPVGAAAHIQGMLADPFAASNPQLEEMVRLQQEDLERAHQGELGDLRAAAGNVGAYGGSDFQLARSAMSGELGRNVERAGTGLRYDDYNRRIADQQQALALGTGLDQSAMIQAVQMEIANRQDLTDRQKTDLSALVTRQLANQGTQAQTALSNRDLQGVLARANQGTQAGLASTGASLATQRSIAARSASVQREALAAQQQQMALQGMLGAAGLQNESQLGRLGLMGGFAGGLGGLEQGAAAGVGAAGGALGQLELGALGAVPGVQGIEMGQLGQAGQLVGQVDRANAQAAAERARAQQAWQQNQLQWDYNRQSGALNDLINQGLSIGGHITTPTGMDPRYLGGGMGGGGAGLSSSGYSFSPTANTPQNRARAQAAQAQLPPGAGGGAPWAGGFQQSAEPGRTLEDSIGGAAINAQYGGQQLTPGGYAGVTTGMGSQFGPNWAQVNPYGLDPSTPGQVASQIAQFALNPAGLPGNILGGLGRLIANRGGNP